MRRLIYEKYYTNFFGRNITQLYLVTLCIKYKIERVFNLLGYISIWVQRFSLRLRFLRFMPFFFLHAFQLQGTKCTVHVLFIHYSRDPQPFYLEKNIYIKNCSHGTIHLFKNYFVIVFSVFNKISCIQTNSFVSLILFIGS